jgi:hypothetical protein
MGLVFKSFLIVALILLFFALIKLTFNTSFITNYLIEKTDKLFYVFKLENKYETKVSIIEEKNISNILLGVTGDNLEFGVIPLKSVSKRFFNLSNNDNVKNYKIQLIVTGNISPMVNFDKNNFILHKDDNTTVTIILDSSLASKSGNYTGEISVISKRPKFSFMDSFMGDSR